MIDKKTEIPGIYRTSEGFLINKDNKSLEAYKMMRSREKHKDEEITNIKEDISSLKNDMQEIKELLKGLVQ